ncbi:hypothetical protein HT031_002300 [Scenedesmus sp. PABB004]|nr:hypothetical protein HT031_002300 [Scenedesmus sp. PABB004]
MEGDAAEQALEITLHVNRQVKVYRIPARPNAGGHRSGDWLVADQLWTGRLRVVACGERVEVRLEEPATGELFAVCPYTPDSQAAAVEPAADSSRYFVLRVEDPSTHRHAFLGLGFSERGEAFDFSAAIADHARQCRRERAAGGGGGGGGGSGGGAPAPAAAGRGDALAPLSGLYKDPGDLSLKEGETMRIDVHRSVAGARQGGGFLSRAGAATLAGRLSADGTGKVLLPPPPAGTLAPPPAVPPLQPAAAAAAAAPPPPAVTVAASEEGWATFD